MIPRQINWGEKEKLMYNICLQLERLNSLAYKIDGNQLTQQGTLLKLPPAYNLASLYLDGTIIDVEGSKYFVDKKAGNNVLINGYDFPDGWVRGFPYKSAATIDVFGQTGVSVNSLFQNFDFADRYFSKHITQSVDANGVELRGAYVSEIVVYSEALTGANLIAANTYFATEAEDLTAVWVSPDGNDATGNGAKATPWLTLDKAVDTVNDGKVIYAKSDDYAGDSSLIYLYNEKTNSLVGVGNVNLITGAAAYAFRIRYNTKPLLQRLNVKPSGNLTNAAIYPLDCKDIEIKNVFVNATATAAIGVLFKKLLNSIISGTYSTSTLAFAVSTANVLIDSNIIKAQAPNFVVGSNVTGVITIKNNRINGVYTGATGYVIWSVNNANTQFVITGNYFDVTGVRIYQKTTDALASIFNYNVVNLKSSLTNSVINIATSYNDNQIAGNKFIDSDNYGSNDIRLISLANTKANISGNLFDIRNTPKLLGAEIYVSKLNTTVIDTVVVSANKILSKRSTGYHIGMGEEATTVGNNTITLPVIEKNYIRSVACYGGEYGSLSVHNTFISFHKNGHIRYNNTEGGGYGAIIKGSVATSYESGGIYYNIIKTHDVFGAYVKGCNGVNVVNNTIIFEHHNPAGAIGLYENTGGDDASNCNVKNNIVIYTGEGDFTAVGITLGTGNQVDYNLYYCPNGNLRFSIGGAYKTFAEWQALGYDTHSIVLTTAQFNGLFTDFANGDYSLKTGSVAIGSGVALDASYDDGLDASTNWGSDTQTPVVVIKQQSALWDIGAYIH